MREQVLELSTSLVCVKHTYTSTYTSRDFAVCNSRRRTNKLNFFSSAADDDNVDDETADDYCGEAQEGMIQSSSSSKSSSSC